MNNIREYARVAMGEDGLVSPGEYRRLMLEMLMRPVRFSNDSDALAYTISDNPFGMAEVVEKRTVCKQYFGALYKVAMEHCK